jgi:hypothetical protein
VDDGIRRLNLALDPAIGKDQEYGKNAIIAFMETLTDSRVQCDEAPSDHPSLEVFNGHELNGDDIISNSRRWVATATRPTTLSCASQMLATSSREACGPAWAADISTRRKRPRDWGGRWDCRERRSVSAVVLVDGVCAEPALGRPAPQVGAARVVTRGGSCW